MCSSISKDQDYCLIEVFSGHAEFVNSNLNEKKIQSQSSHKKFEWVGRITANIQFFKDGLTWILMGEHVE